MIMAHDHIILSRPRSTSTPVYNRARGSASQRDELLQLATTGDSFILDMTADIEGDLRRCTLNILFVLHFVSPPHLPPEGSIQATDLSMKRSSVARRGMGALPSGRPLDDGSRLSGIETTPVPLNESSHGGPSRRFAGGPTMCVRNAL